MNESLRPHQRGDELCSNCRKQWVDHKDNNCPYPDSEQQFIGSGRVAAPSGGIHTHIHNSGFSGFRPSIGPSPNRRI